MFTKIYEILTEFLGESKQGSYSNDVFQYQFNCPQCREENDGVPDGKFNLEVNLQIQRFHCWKCGDTDNMKGKVSYLIKRYGNSSLYKSYKDEIESIRKTRMYDFNLYSGLTLDIDTDFYLKLPKTYKKLNLSNAPKAVYEYCLKRKRFCLINRNIRIRFKMNYSACSPFKF